MISPTNGVFSAIVETLKKLGNQQEVIMQKVTSTSSDSVGTAGVTNKSIK